MEIIGYNRNTIFYCGLKKKNSPETKEEIAETKEEVAPK